MELKNLQSFYECYKDAWWITAHDCNEGDADSVPNIDMFRSLIVTIRPDYKQDILGIMDALIKFHNDGCPEEEGDALVMMDYPTFCTVLEQAQKTMTYQKNLEMASILDCLECESDEEAAAREFKDLADSYKG